MMNDNELNQYENIIREAELRAQEEKVKNYQQEKDLNTNNSKVFK